MDSMVQWLQERFVTMNTCTVIALAFLTVMPAFAQESVTPPPAAQSGQAAESEAGQVPAKTVSSESSRPKEVSTDGTVGRLAKFDGSSTVTDSALFESAGKIGLGTTAPASALHVLIPDGTTNLPLKLETSGADSVTGISLNSTLSDSN
jgi:hypothetical protein